MAGSRPRRGRFQANRPSSTVPSSAVTRLAGLDASNRNGRKSTVITAHGIWAGEVG